MKKRIISIFISAIMLILQMPMSTAAETAVLSPRSCLDIEDGYLCGFNGIPVADQIAEQFCRDIIITDPAGNVISGNAVVPCDSTVNLSNNELAKILVPGDVDRSASVDMADITAILKVLAKWNTDICTSAADVNLDGVLDIADAIYLLKYIAGWNITLFHEITLNVDFDEYVLLANDAETDAEIVRHVKENTGVDITVVTKVTEGMKYVTVGKELWNDYTFMDTVACRSLFPENSYIDTYNGNIYLTACGDEGINGCVDFLASPSVYQIPRGYTGTIGHLTGESQLLYSEAVEKIKALDANGGSSEWMSDDVYLALANAEYTEPKNIILLIGDGMGLGAVNSAEIVHKSELHNGILAMRHMPVKGYSRTFSAIDHYTDSAAGGSALATGYKTTECTVAMDPNHTTDRLSVSEIAAKIGKSVGVISTTAVYDATPAAFTAHAESRFLSAEIVKDQLMMLSSGNLDLLLGGGSFFYDLEEIKDPLDAALAEGVTYVKDWNDIKTASLPMLGLVSEYDVIQGEISYPSVAEMTEYALDRLSENENGFFLMVEGAKIDSYAHNNEFEKEVAETYNFDCAVSVALKYAALNPDTVVIVTADHETGGLSVPSDATAENIMSQYKYFMGRHHWINVPVFAVGYGTGVLGEVVENTDIAIFIADLMGESDFGYRSNCHLLFDLSDIGTKQAIIDANGDDVSVTEEGLVVCFGKNNRDIDFPMSQICADPADLKNVRAVNITWTNTGDATVNLPGVKYIFEGQEYIMREWTVFLKPGESMSVSYPIPSEMIGEGNFMSMTGLQLSGSQQTSTEFLITGITVTVRESGF